MTTSQGGVTGAEILAYAIQTFGGLPYTWGNNDCSGIVQKTYAHFGISLPRVSSQQWSSGTPVAESDLQPGDLVFFNPGTSGAPPGLPGHVGFYAGNGNVFSAYNPSRGILTMPLSQVGTYMGARRIVGSAGNGTGVAAGLSTGGVSFLSATPISTADASTQTVNASGAGSTCAFALGTSTKVLIFNMNFSVCIISKHEARAIIGALTLMGGAIITMVGAAIVLQYALDKSKLAQTISDLPGGGTLMATAKKTGGKLPGGGKTGHRGNSGGKSTPKGKKSEKTARQVAEEKRKATSRGEYVEVT